MTCKSAIYTVNNTNTSITVTNDISVQVPFGSVIRRFGNCVELNGGSILCYNSGYFDVEISISVTITLRPRLP